MVLQDLKGNRIRLVIAAGAGTVREEMWDPDSVHVVQRDQVLEVLMFHRPRPIAGDARGFTLIEVVVALAVFAIFMIGILNLLDTSTRISEVEKALADTQENVRFAAYHLMRTTRMTGGAGMPFAEVAGSPGKWVAGELLSNQSGSVSTLYPLGAIDVLDGTDVVTVRGLFEIPPYFVDKTAVDLSLGRIQVVESVSGRRSTPESTSLTPIIWPGAGWCSWVNWTAASTSWARSETRRQWMAPSPTERSPFRSATHRRPGGRSSIPAVPPPRPPLRSTRSAFSIPTPITWTRSSA